jgi:MFS family permease
MARRRAGRLWSNADFLKLWGGETISQFGTQVTTLAMPLTAILVLHAGPGQIGLLNAASYLPFLIVTLFAGVWVDRHRRRPILVASNAGRALILVAVPLLGFTHLLRIEHLYLAVLLVGLLTVLFELAYQSYLPSLVDRAALIEGNSKLQVSASAAQVGGPGLGGLLIQFVTAPVALLADAASYLVSVLSLLTIRCDEPAPEVAAAGPRQHVWREIREGLRFTFGNRYLRAFALEAATYNMSYLIMETVFLLYAIHALRLSPGAVGLILSAGAAGSLAGSLLPQRLADRFGVGRVIVWSVVIATAVPVLVPLAAGSRPMVIAVLVASFFFGGAGSIITSIHVVSLRQTITPDRLLGRMNASYRFVTWGIVPVGALAGGFLGNAIGLRPTLFVAAAGLFGSSLFIVFSPVRGLRGVPDAVDIQPAASDELPPCPSGADSLLHQAGAVGE